MNGGIDPVVVGKNVVVLYDTNNFDAFAQNDGKKIWIQAEDSQQGLYKPTYITTANTLYSGKEMFVPTASPTVMSNGVEGVGQDYVDVRARALSDGKLLWSQRMDGSIEPPLLATVPYGLSVVAGNHLSMFDSEHGTKLWEKVLPWTKTETPHFIALAAA